MRTILPYRTCTHVRHVSLNLTKVNKSLGFNLQNQTSFQHHAFNHYIVVFLQRDWGKFNAGLLRSERSGERESVSERTERPTLRASASRHAKSSLSGVDWLLTICGPTCFIGSDNSLRVRWGLQRLARKGHEIARVGHYCSLTFTRRVNYGSKCGCHVRHHAMTSKSFCCETLFLAR